MLDKARKFGKYLGSAYLIHKASIVAAFAQNDPRSIIGNLSNTANAGGGNLLGFIQAALNLAIGLAGLIAVAFLILSGIQYILAGGDEGKIDKATKGITYAIVGLVICFIAVLIVNFVLDRVLGV